MVSLSAEAGLQPASYARGAQCQMGTACGRAHCARSRVIYLRRANPREGDERLSGTKRGKSGGVGRNDVSGGSPNPPKKKQRTADLGRALRSVYDDTLRETVPDEFTDLLGKLS